MSVIFKLVWVRVWSTKEKLKQNTDKTRQKVNCLFLNLTKILLNNIFNELNGDTQIIFRDAVATLDSMLLFFFPHKKKSQTVEQTGRQN